MLHPVRTETYTFKSVPLTPEEKAEAAKKGQPTKAIRGTFKFRGFGGRKNRDRRILVFQGTATVEDGVIFTGPRVALSVEDFDLGVSLGKIRGRARKS